jgi:hypothetical protein
MQVDPPVMQVDPPFMQVEPPLMTWLVVRPGLGVVHVDGFRRRFLGAAAHIEPHGRCSTREASRARSGVPLAESPPA